jgi:hypothetical protein
MTPFGEAVSAQSGDSGHISRRDVPIADELKPPAGHQLDCGFLPRNSWLQGGDPKSDPVSTVTNWLHQGSGRSDRCALSTCFLLARTARSSHHAGSLPEDTIARFVFHAPLKKAARDEQERAIKARLRKLKLSKAATAQVLKLEGVSSAQLESAVKASRLVEARNRVDRDRALVQAVRRSQRALSRDLTEGFKPCTKRSHLSGNTMDLMRSNVVAD